MARKPQCALFFIMYFFTFLNVNAKAIQTNAVNMSNAPEWLKRVRAEKVIDRIQMHLEWRIRRVQAYWYNTQIDFEKIHSLGPTPVALTKRKDQSMHFGPRVTTKNFDSIFGHELVHVIFRQKHKKAIPKWLEEGLANYWAKQGRVNYKWLATQPYPKDVRKLTHPYKKSNALIKYHYMASQALIEMIASKCDLTNLLRLSVERKMENYIHTYCEIKDINKSFRAWVAKKSK